MQNSIHTILGATGAVGQAVIKTLQQKELPLRSVSRKATSELPNHFQADLLNKSDTQRAIEGSAFVYLCVGLPYTIKVWERDWELIMENVIEACATHNAKLIFLDNIYMYAPPLPVPFDEDTPQGPTSKKGKVRKRVADKLMQAMEQGAVKGLIARAADFYGEGAVNSIFYVSFLERILKGKNPQLLSKGDVQHTFANVTDIGRALVMLALCEECYGEVWHLPVGEPITMEEILSITNKQLGTQYKISVLPNLLKKILPMFIPIIGEALEMQYQFEQEYVMSFQKFQQKFPEFKLTSYEEGIAQMITWMKKTT